MAWAAAWEGIGSAWAEEVDAEAVRLEAMNVPSTLGGRYRLSPAGQGALRRAVRSRHLKPALGSPLRGMPEQTQAPASFDAFARP